MVARVFSQILVATVVFLYHADTVYNTTGLALFQQPADSLQVATYNLRMLHRLLQYNYRFLTKFLLKEVLIL